jgi:hypothetical protein
VTIDFDAAPPGADGRDPAADGWSRYAGGIIGARELKAALRRRRRIWAGAAAAGLLLGASLHVLLPPTYKAVGNIYLSEPPGSAPSVEMANEVSLLQTRAVAQRAAGYLSGRPSGQGLPGAYRGDSLSLSIFSISATGTSPSAAIALENAVAKAFLAVRSDELKRESEVLVSGLQAKMAAMRSDPSSDETQILQLQAQVTSVQLELQSSIGGSFVLDAGSAVKTSTKKAAVEDSLAGLVAGLALGGGIVVVGEILSESPRRRAEVAAALGTGVELSLPRSRSRHWGRRTAKLAKPRPPTVALERRLRAHLEAAPDRSLAVFVVGAEREAAVAVASLATSLASEGRSVVLLDMAEGRPIAALFRLKDKLGPVHQVDRGGHMVTVAVAPADPAQDIASLDRAGTDYLIVLAGVDPGLGVDHISGWARDAVAIVGAAKATYTRLDGMGRIIDQAGIALRSAFLIGADADDDSLGSVDYEAGRVKQEPALEAVPVASGDRLGTPSASAEMTIETAR